MRIMPCAVLLVVASFGWMTLQSYLLGAAAQEKACFSRWAIIASHEVRESGLTDLVAARLVEVQHLELLDREHLNALTEEQALRLLAGGSVAGDVEACQLLRADALAILCLEQGKKGEMIRLVISDSLYGARLKTEFFAFDSEKERCAAAIAESILQTRRQFAGGIDYLLAVPSFISRDLAHRYDHMQAGTAILLGEALRQHPGVAVIETEEALSIRRELQLSAGELRDRKVPLLVEGEYETHQTEEGGRTISYSIRIANGNHVTERFQKENIPLEAVKDYLRGELCRRIVRGATTGEGERVDRLLQFDALVRRADAFAEVGSWYHSTGLREAALLLREDAARQRIELLSEYARIIGANYGRAPMTRETIQKMVNERMGMWMTGLGHLEYLIRNKQVSLPHATELASDFEPLAYPHFFRGYEMPFDFFDEGVRFFRSVIPPGDLLAQKDNAGRLNVTYGLRGQMFKFVLRRATDSRSFTNLKVREHKKELGILLEVMDRWLKEDMCSLGQLCYRLGASHPRHTGQEDYSEYHEAWIEFLRGLSRSDKVHNAFYGRYGLFMYDYWADRTPSEERLAQFDALIQQYEQLPTRTRQESTVQVLGDKLRSCRRSVYRGLHPEKENTSTHVYHPRPKPKADSGRIRFEPLQLRVEAKEGSLVDFKSKTWRSYGGWGGMSNWISCGPGLDVLWNLGAVLAMHTPGVAKELYVDKEPVFDDVEWDGRHIWVGTRNAGVWVLDRTCKMVARFDDTTELPPADKKIVLHSLEKGRMAAAGCFGPHGRAWCAILTLEDNKPNVNVFHRAVKVMRYDDDKMPLARDPLTAFQPSWMHVFHPAGENQTPRLLIGRGDYPRGWFPLTVDLETLKVEGYPGTWPKTCFPGPGRTSEHFFSNNGKLLVGCYTAGADVYEPVDNGLLFKRVRAARHSGMGGYVHRATFIEQDGWVYCSDYGWSRFDRDTLEEEVLSSDRMPTGFNDMYTAKSSHYGIIGMKRGTVYRITVLDDDDVPDQSTHGREP